MISEAMIGRIALGEHDAALLEKYALRCSTWLEIGTLWGGSAILAALANPELQVTTIDPMFGYYERNAPDKWERYQRVPTMNAVHANFAAFNVEERITMVPRASMPWPLPAEQRFDAVFIDGSHEPIDLESDLRNAQQVARKYILVHDTDDAQVDTTVAAHLHWPLEDTCERMQVYAR